MTVGSRTGKIRPKAQAMQLITHSSQALLRVRKVVVEGLFGLYNHTIDLNYHERVTIIHGPNGVGKTKILQLLASLLGGDLVELTDVPFDRFAVYLDDDSRLEVTPTEDQSKYSQPGVCVALVSETERHEHSVFKPSRAITTVLSQFETIKYYVEYFDTSADRPADRPIPQPKKTLYPEWLKNTRNRVKVHFIETQRLLRQHAKQAPVLTVQEYSADLLRRIEETLAAYAGKSQLLDQSFPQRLLQQSQAGASIAELKTRMAELDEIRQLYASLGLLDDLPQHPFDLRMLDSLDTNQAAVLTLYVGDTEAKLGVLKDLATRIRLLLDNINEKFINKQIHVDQREGLVAKAGNQELRLSDLSSGEQHEIVILYDLLFNIRPNTLVLIDEPELSLHVVWQKHFLPDLLEIAQTAGLDVLVATHSPFIIGEREDLLVDLSAHPIAAERHAAEFTQDRINSPQ
jgi:predicted ATPase